MWHDFASASAWRYEILVPEFAATIDEDEDSDELPPDLSTFESAEDGATTKTNDVLPSPVPLGKSVSYHFGTGASTHGGIERGPSPGKIPVIPA